MKAIALERSYPVTHAGIDFEAMGVPYISGVQSGPFPHLLLIRMFRVIDRFEKILIAPYATTILGWAL